MRLGSFSFTGGFVRQKAEQMTHDTQERDDAPDTERDPALDFQITKPKRSRTRCGAPGARMGAPGAVCTVLGTGAHGFNGEGNKGTETWLYYPSAVRFFADGSPSSLSSQLLTVSCADSNCGCSTTHSRTFS